MPNRVAANASCSRGFGAARGCSCSLRYLKESEKLNFVPGGVWGLSVVFFIILGQTGTATSSPATISRPQPNKHITRTNKKWSGSTKSAFWSLCGCGGFMAATRLVENQVLFCCCNIFWRLSVCGIRDFLHTTYMHLCWGWLVVDVETC